MVLDFPTFTQSVKFDEDEIVFYAFECQKDESQRDSSSHGDVMNLLIVGCVRVPGFVPIKLMRDEKNETLPRKEMRKKTKDRVCDVTIQEYRLQFLELAFSNGLSLSHTILNRDGFYFLSS